MGFRKLKCERQICFFNPKRTQKTIDKSSLPSKYALVALLKYSNISLSLPNPLDSSDNISFSLGVATIGCSSETTIFLSLPSPS